MALTIGDNFSYQGAKPLDTRLQYATIAEMASKADSTLYDGIIAYCKADGKNYQWKSTNTVDPTLGKWREFQSGGGGVSELANLDDVDLDDPADGEVLKYNATEEKWVNGEDIGGVGRAKSTSIASVFDETATYAAGDRVTYEDELYVFNKAHTGAWAAADVDKTDVDTLTERMPATDMSEVASPMPSVMSRLPVLFDESGTEQVVGWYKYANGTKKPVYEKVVEKDNPTNDSTIISLPNVTIISIIGWAYDNANKNGIQLGYMGYFGIYQRTSTGDIEYYSDKSPAYYASKVRLIIKYTKTTDTPQ